MLAIKLARGTRNGGWSNQWTEMNIALEAVDREKVCGM